MPSDAFPITYEMSSDAPASMGTDEYVDRVSRAWAELLKSDPDEPAVQAFLQNHPLLVPGAHLGLGRLRETRPLPLGADHTRPPLRGLTARIPDFLWIASDSVFLNPRIHRNRGSREAVGHSGGASASQPDPSAPSTRRVARLARPASQP
jgi:hypothetical protein